MKTNEVNTPTKVAVLIRNFSDTAGGAERYCVELTKKLASVFDVHVFCQEKSIVIPNIEFHKIPKIINKPRFLNQLFFSLATRLYTKNKFDIIHSHDMVTHANIYTLHVPCVRSSLKFETNVHKFLSLVKILFSPRIYTYLYLEKKQMSTRCNKKIITVSNLLKDNIAESYPNLEELINVVEPGYELEKLEPNEMMSPKELIKRKLGIGTNNFVVLFVGHGFERKGLPKLIMALQKINEEPISLVVAGRGGLHNNSSTNKNIFFVGEYEKMSELYSIADILVHPTLGDTFGMSILEAMSHSVPVIVSAEKYCGISSNLTDKINALIINNPHDDEEIKEKILLLYENLSLRSNISEEGLKLIKKFNWQNTFIKTKDLYDSLIQDK